MPLLYLSHEAVHRLRGFVLLLPCGVGVGAEREARGRLLHRDSLFDHQLVAVGCGDTDVWLCVNVVPASQPCGDGIFIGAAIVVLDMPLLDTRRGKDLMGTFLSDIVLQILSFVAENERTAIHQRQAEGIAAARARGVRFGRPPNPLPDNFSEMCRQWRAGEMTCTAAAQACGMALTTFRYQAAKLQQDYTKKNVYRNV